MCVVADLRVTASERVVSFLGIGVGGNCLIQLLDCLLRFASFSQKSTQQRMVVCNRVGQRSGSLCVNVRVVWIVGAVESDRSAVCENPGCGI
jgi:hypothetical protein